MPRCRECHMERGHKMSCSRRKHGGRTYVSDADASMSSWPAGAVYDSSNYGDAGGSSCSSSSSDSGSSSSCGGGGE